MKRWAVLAALLTGCATFQPFNESDRKTDVLQPLIKKAIETNKKIVAPTPVVKRALDNSTFLLNRAYAIIKKQETDLRSCSLKVREQDQKIADLSKDAGIGVGIMGLIWGVVALLGVAAVLGLVWKWKSGGLL